VLEHPKIPTGQKGGSMIRFTQSVVRIPGSDQVVVLSRLVMMPATHGGGGS
jgi:hypothetical protein